MKKFYQKLK